jgi:hypothetical protein
VISQFSSTYWVSIWAPLVARDTSKRYSTSYHVFRNITLDTVPTVSVSVRCSIISWGSWIPQILQLCLFTILSTWNFTSSKTHRVQESLITANFLQHFFTESLPVVSQEKTPDLRTLRRRITETTATVTEVMFVSTWHQVEWRFDVFLSTNGAYTETYWVTEERRVLCCWIVISLRLYIKCFSVYEFFFLAILGLSVGEWLPAV